ncbi:MAG: DUF86 domain-containing protein [Betaproteobacteria bacterium]|nr:MAG: DUF86 domain-containing protein [Betaproteobacteria bacterium]
MRRAPDDCLREILDAIAAIRVYTSGGRQAFESSPMVRDAVVARLMQIGQAVKDAQSQGLDLPRLQPDIAWRDVAGMRDRLAHRYWAMDVTIVWGAVETDLPKLGAAVEELLGRALPRPAAPRRRGRKSHPS